MKKNPVPPGFIQLLWSVIDRLLIMSRRIKPLRTDGSGILSLEARRYKGCRVKLDDGSKVKTGDKIIELHLSSAWFRRRRKLSLTTQNWQWQVLCALAQDLSLLAQQMSHSMFRDITALHGSTLLHVGAKRIGLEVKELPNSLWKKCAQFYLRGLMQIHYLGKEERLKGGDRGLELKEVWLSRSALLRRYGLTQQATRTEEARAP